MKGDFALGKGTDTPPLRDEVQGTFFFKNNEST